jgi:hypothetical protein
MNRKPTEERYEGSLCDMINDIRGARMHGMSPADFDGSVWDQYEDRAGQRRLEQKANKSRAWATFR